MRMAVVLSAGVMLGAAACSGQPQSPTGTPSRDPVDPLEPVNRVVYMVNDFGDRYLLRPAAVGYEKTLPRPVRTGIGNVFENLLYPVTIVNSFLQGKFADGGRDTGRFLLNSTVGLLGIFDPASEIGLPLNDEDFGQTLNVWGVPEGPYLMVPVFGPRTLTHGIGNLVDSPLTPLSITRWEALNLSAYALYAIDQRSGLLDVDDQVREAYDPYVFVRDAYLQNRRYKASDGSYEGEELYLEDEEP